jgi:hypothetical protein
LAVPYRSQSPTHQLLERLNTPKRMPTAIQAGRSMPSGGSHAVSPCLRCGELEATPTPGLDGGTEVTDIGIYCMWY